MNYKLIFVIIFAIIAISPAIVHFYYNEPHFEQKIQNVVSEEPIASIEFQSKTPKELESGVEFEVESCRILDGFRFEMDLESNKSIIAHLTTATSNEASVVVVDLMNKAKNPVVKLLRKVNDYWIVELSLFIDGKKVNIIDVLKMQGLLL